MAPLHKLTQVRPMTVGAIKNAAASPAPDAEELANALIAIAESRSGEIDALKLGRYLGRVESRVVDGLKLISTVDRHAKQKAWQVVRV